jgi:hypothetical protein
MPIRSRKTEDDSFTQGQTFFEKVVQDAAAVTPVNVISTVVGAALTGVRAIFPLLILNDFRKPVIFPA